MSDSEYIPVCQSGYGYDSTNKVIAKAKIDTKKRIITIEYPEGGNLDQFLEIGELNLLFLGASLNKLDTDKAKKYWENN